VTQAKVFSVMRSLRPIQIDSVAMPRPARTLVSATWVPKLTTTACPLRSQARSALVKFTGVSYQV
jgi:hypothetical protein